MIARRHEPITITELQDAELGVLQRGSQAAGNGHDLVRSHHELEAKPTGKRGRKPDYRDAASQTCLMMKLLFSMALQQTTGFVEGLLRLTGLAWSVPNFSTLSRRPKTMKVNFPYRGSEGPPHLLIDSTGIKVEGEGEWNARNHGGPKRRCR